MEDSNAACRVPPPANIPQTIGFSKKTLAQGSCESLAPRLLYRQHIKAKQGAADETITRNHV